MNIKIKKIIESALVIIIILYVGAITYPYILFKHSIKYKNIEVYSTKPIDSSIIKVLSSSFLKLDKTTIDDTTKIHEIFLCNNFTLYSCLAPTSRKAFGCNYIYLNSIFIAKCNVNKNESYKNDNTDNYVRNLDEVIAHEISHRLLLNKFGVWKNKWIENWKNEGFCETIGYGQIFNLIEAKNFITKNKNNNGHRVYYKKCFYAVSYLMTERKMTLNEIISSKITLEDTLKLIQTSK